MSEPDDETELYHAHTLGRSSGFEEARALVMNMAKQAFVDNKDDEARLLREIAMHLKRRADETRNEVS